MWYLTSLPVVIRLGTIPVYTDITLKKFNLLALVLNPKGEPSGLKDYNNLNKVNTDNILSFINYTTIDK